MVKLTIPGILVPGSKYARVLFVFETCGRGENAPVNLQDKNRGSWSVRVIRILDSRRLQP